MNEFGFVARRHMDMDKIFIGRDLISQRRMLGKGWDGRWSAVVTHWREWLKEEVKEGANISESVYASLSLTPLIGGLAQLVDSWLYFSYTPI